ncbi:Hsp70 family protein [Variovorax sp. YR216]|uniref:Hsp70 family protein n=1 Tax=Variovorax sp. YR216 TaxID=1882828 RepID=UPI00089B1D21|nr:Hsp70 family protein [Variovorax sp. YR216]SEB24353.1 Hsp70 protein [Variovorax sp. YR216]
MTAAYTVGIDLGTTHTVVAYAAAQGPIADDDIRLFNVEQLVAPGEVAARPLLPSMRYHPLAGELAPGDLALPWAPGGTLDAEVIGTLARQLGAQVPGRLVSSAKSWLSHAAVDRLAPILPWGAAADVPKVSPVAASASYLAHLRSAWNHRFPQALLEHQELVLTVPASFDDAARALTLEAARDAGLPVLRLLEEPQAALYDWLFRQRNSLAEALAGTQLVLVCDVGGGTTDLSLVRVDQHGTEPRLERIAVGRHLMLGGDNMDLALAHLAESRLNAAAVDAGAAARLSTGQLSQLVERCRAAKERLLAADAPASAPVTLLGAGARLIGAARSVVLERDEVERIVVDGFFPQVAAGDLPRRERASGLVTFGLPYASDPAVTRHIAGFLRQHAAAGWPDALLLNGGVFRAEAIAARLHATLGAWRGAPLRILHNADPDVAVARGAVAYALARRGLAPKIGGGSARSYFLPLGDGKGRAVCVLPNGSEEGREIRLEGRSFELRVGEPVRFHLVSTTGDIAAKPAPLAGELVDLDEREVQVLPPVATVVRAGGSARRNIPVQLAAMLTEVGTLEVHCISANDPAQRWKLEFQLRADSTAPVSPGAGLPPRFGEAIECIERVFGARDRDVGPKAVKQLRAQLEALLGTRERWSTALLRPLFDALWQRARGRHRSADHERLWLSLAGWCLRPGFGDALDAWRIEQLWPLFELGVQHGHERQVDAEWWTLWRRVAGGLDEAAQLRLLDDFAINLQGEEAGIERPPRLVKGGWDDMVRMGASLERIPVEHKVEIGDWLVERLQRPGAARDPQARDTWTLWAIGRIGARAPLYGSAHGVVPVDHATAWLDALLALDWKRVEGAAAAAANLSRLSGDRARDLPLEARQRVISLLEAHRAPSAWIARVCEVVPLDEAGERGVFGEALPPGLKLIG